MSCMKPVPEGSACCPVCGYDGTQQNPAGLLPIGTRLDKGGFIVGRILKVGKGSVDYAGYDAAGSRPMAVSLGGGAAVKVKDSSVVCDREVVKKMRALCEENGIRYQLEVLAAGGTDTSSMQAAASGARAGCISIPTRYIHSSVETVDLDDVEACVRLTEAIAAE